MKCSASTAVCQPSAQRPSPNPLQTSARNAMSGHYQKFGLNFLYPENWELIDADDSERPFDLALHSPHGAMMSLTFFDPQEDSAEVLRTYLDSLQEQYEDLELTPASDEIAGIAGQGVDGWFYCLDFLVTAKIRLYQTPEYQVVILAQAESRAFDSSEPVFAAIKTSLLRNATPAGT